MQGNISIKKLHYTIDNLKENCKHEKNTPSPFTVLMVRPLARAEGPRKFLNLESPKCHFLEFGEDLTEF
jgi:hypothetical protein